MAIIFSWKFFNKKLEAQNLSESYFFVQQYEVIPDRGNPLWKWTMPGGYLFEYGCVTKYLPNIWEHILENWLATKKTQWKDFQIPLRTMKHQLICPFEVNSKGSLMWCNVK